MRTIKIKNGDFYEDFTYYDCEKCGKEIPESHGYSEENGFKFCHECSFIKGLINEETYLSIHGIHLNSFHAAIIPGTEKIYVWYSKSKVAPWDLEKSGRRNTTPYGNFRKKVLERDLYTCKLCGYTGNKLNVHHIKSFKNYPELRTDISNGITVCSKCHKEFHKKRGESDGV